MAAGVSQALHAGWRVNRSLPLSRTAMAIPSPSWNAVAMASAIRPAAAGRASRRSTTTSSSPVLVRSSRSGSSSRRCGVPSTSTRTKPRAVRFSTTASWVSRATGGSGKLICTRPGPAARISSAADWGVSRRTGAPHSTTEAPSGPRPEKPEVVVDLGSGADGRSTRDGRVALLDGDRRGETLEPVYERFRHPIEKLLGICRKRFDVPALALGVDRIEGQRALARTGRTCDHGQRAVRQLDVDALEVVLPGVHDADDGI